MHLPLDYKYAIVDMGKPYIIITFQNDLIIKDKQFSNIIENLKFFLNEDVYTLYGYIVPWVLYSSLSTEEKSIYAELDEIPEYVPKSISNKKRISFQIPKNIIVIRYIE